MQRFQGVNSWNHTEFVLLSLWSYVKNQYQKYFKIIHIFSRVTWHLSREIFDLAIESLNKFKRVKKTQRVIAEKKAFKWEINIKYTLKTPCIWKLNAHFKMTGVSKMPLQRILENICNRIEMKREFIRIYCMALKLHNATIYSVASSVRCENRKQTLA